MDPFDFSDMLPAYSVSITIYKAQVGTQGWDPNTGDPIKPTASQPIDTTGAVIPLSSNQIYQSGGRLTDSDRQLIIDDPDIPPKSLIVCGGQKYSVEQMIPYHLFADFTQYELKWVSAFDNESNI